jgi:acyl-CoA thioesterase FadM
MNLWFRLFWMLVTVRWRGKARPFDTTVLRLRVLPNDLDFNGHMTNGRYFTVADVGRMDYVLRTGTLKVAMRERAAPIVGDAAARFRRELRLFEAYELQSRLLGWDDKWTFMEHRFVCKGRVAGVVVMRGLFRAAGGAVAPGVFSKALGMDGVSPTLPESVVGWSRSCDQLADTLRNEEQLAR